MRLLNMLASVAGGLFLSVTAGSCAADSTAPMGPETTKAQRIPMREYKGARPRPPSLTYGAMQIRPYTVDWKYGVHTERLDQSGNFPSPFGVSGRAPSQITLSDSLAPEYLQISIFDGPLAGIDPLSAPDRTFICTPTDHSVCTTSAENNTVMVRLPSDALPGSGNVVLSVSAEYLAEPELHAERFVNTVSWVLALDITQEAQMKECD